MILILNCGSQSVKWKVFDGNLNLISGGRNEYFSWKSANEILKKELKKIKNNNWKIDFIGYRVVHPVAELAPLHNPFEYLGIKTAKKEFPKAKHIVVFDTDFFNDLPEAAKIYALPESLTKKYKIRRYGFHGISHKYLAEKAAEILKKPLNKLNLITLHLGGGASITAIKDGKPMDTSMGFTPLEGLTMMTRAGDIDPGILIFLAKRMKIGKLDEILNRESGLKAICGESDFRKILKRKDKKAKLAKEIFSYKIRKYLSAYFGILNGKVDAVVFGGQIGAGNPEIRKLVLKDLKFLRNAKILTVQTDEEWQIAKEVKIKWQKYFKKIQ